MSSDAAKIILFISSACKCQQQQKCPRNEFHLCGHTRGWETTLDIEVIARLQRPTLNAPTHRNGFFSNFVALISIFCYDEFQHLGSTFPALFCGQLARVHLQIVKNQGGDWQKSAVYVPDYLGLHFRHHTQIIVQQRYSYLVVCVQCRVGFHRFVPLFPVHRAKSPRSDEAGYEVTALKNVHL
jgi:hypothetical protein